MSAEVSISKVTAPAGPWLARFEEHSTTAICPACSVPDVVTETLVRAPDTAELTVTAAPLDVAVHAVGAPSAFQIERDAVICTTPLTTLLIGVKVNRTLPPLVPVT